MSKSALVKKISDDNEWLMRGKTMVGLDLSERLPMIADLRRLLIFEKIP